MKTSTGKPTKAEARWMDAIREKGCIACRMDGRGKVLCEVHHLNEGGQAGSKRRGHAFTVGLCSWHHRGVSPREGLPASRAEAIFGPSLARTSKAFRDRYGDDDRLLQYQDEILCL